MRGCTDAVSTVVKSSRRHGFAQCPSPCVAGIAKRRASTSGAATASKCTECRQCSARDSDASKRHRLKPHLRLIDSRPRVWCHRFEEDSMKPLERLTHRRQLPNRNHRVWRNDVSRTLIDVRTPRGTSGARGDRCRRGVPGGRRCREQRHRDPAVPGQRAEGGPRRSPPAARGHALAHQGARQGSVAGRAARDAQRARPLLVDRVRLAEGRGQAECLPAVRDEDRRRGHPLHPRQVASP